MPDDLNLLAHEDWQQSIGSARGSQLGPALGTTRLGASLYELDPGGQAAPYHLHHGNDELLVVLAGELELRTPEGVRTLATGEIAGFPSGPEGAHRVRNAGTIPARYLVVSTMRLPDVAVQLDTGTLLAITSPTDGHAFPAGSDDDYMRLTMAALAADPGAAS